MPQSTPNEPTSDTTRDDTGDTGDTVSVVQRRSLTGWLGAGLVTLAVFGAAPAVGMAGSSFGPQPMQLMGAPAAPAAQVVWEAPAPPPALALAEDGVGDVVADSSGVAEASEALAPAPADLASAAGAAAATAPARAMATMARAERRGSGGHMLSAATAPTAPKARTTARTTSSKSKRQKRCAAQPDQPMISRTDSGSFAVDRDLVRSYARSPKRINQLGWSRPHKDDGGSKDGMLIGGVRCGSDLHQAGIRSGDVIHTVNGRKVKSYAQALLVYTAVRNDEVIVVELTRRGSRKTLRYRIS